MRLAHRVQTVEASQTIRLDTQAKTLLAQGQPVINLTAGELDFSVPAVVTQAVEQALHQPTHRYSGVAGTIDARQQIVEYLHERHTLTYQADQVIVTNGAKHALFCCFQTLVNPGDEVLVLVPGWVSYSEQIKLAGGVPIFVETAENFQPDLTLLEQALTSRTVGLVLNYPNNPTGAVYSPVTLQALAQFATQHKLWVLSDEIYEQLLYDQTEFRSFAHFFPEAILINGLSKSAAVTGWRVGYAVGPRTFIQALTTFQSHCTGNVSHVMQAAIGQGLLLPTDIRADWLKTLHERRQLIINWVKTQPRLKLIPPSGAFYCFFDIRALSSDSVQFCEQLLNQAHVALVPGKYFGRDGFVRLSFANSTALLREALQRLDHFISTMV